MNVTIDRNKFKELLVQFKGDIGYQTDLVLTLLDQLPDNYVNTLINTLYYERVYKGTYYMIQHSVYSYDKIIFENFSECLAYLNSINMDERQINKFGLLNAIEKGIILSGYRVFKIVNKEEV